MFQAGLGVRSQLLDPSDVLFCVLNWVLILILNLYDSPGIALVLVIGTVLIVVGARFLLSKDNSRLIYFPFTRFTLLAGTFIPATPTLTLTIVFVDCAEDHLARLI